MGVFSNSEKENNEEIQYSSGKKKSGVNQIGYSMQDSDSELIQMMNNSNPFPQERQAMQLMSQNSESTGNLPKDLKQGVEGLSGMNMGDVNVHYNSSKPAEVGAHAYAQGTNIHLAPGQEQHLPHEAWHVVQQKQGRVAPTKQLKGKNINDQEELEVEADVMGAKAIQGGQGSPSSPLDTGSAPSDGAIQRQAFDPLYESIPLSAAKELSEDELLGLIQQVEYGLQDYPDDEALLANYKNLKKAYNSKQKKSSSSKKKSKSKTSKKKAQSYTAEELYDLKMELEDRLAHGIITQEEYDREYVVLEDAMSESNAKEQTKKEIEKAEEKFYSELSEDELWDFKHELDDRLYHGIITQEEYEREISKQEKEMGKRVDKEIEQKEKLEKIHTRIVNDIIGYLDKNKPNEAFSCVSNYTDKYLAQIRYKYIQITGRKLEIDLLNHGVKSEKLYHTFFQILQFYDKLYLRAQDGNSKQILVLFENVKSNYSALYNFKSANYKARCKWLRDVMDEKDYFKARDIILNKIKDNAEQYELVKEKIGSAKGYFKNDITLILNSIMDLSLTYRKMLWFDDRAILKQYFIYLPDSPEEGSLAHAIKMLCTGTNAQMIRARVILATQHAFGTDEAGTEYAMQKLKGLDQDTRDEILSGNDAPTALHKSTLEMIDDDYHFGDSEDYLNHLKMAGTPRYQLAKEIVLRSINCSPTVYESRMKEAFALLKDQSERTKFSNEQDLRRVFDRYKYVLCIRFPELSKLDDIINNDTYKLVLHELRNTDDCVDLLKIILKMSDKDRKKFESKKPDIYYKILNNKDYTLEERELLAHAVKTGRLSIDKAMAYGAQETNSDKISWGTREEVFELLFDKLTDEERKIYRMGFVIFKRGHFFPEDRYSLQLQMKAFCEFFELNQKLMSETGSDRLEKEYHDLLVKLIGPPKIEEFMQTDDPKLLADTTKALGEEKMDRVEDSAKYLPYDALDNTIPIVGFITSVRNLSRVNSQDEAAAAREAMFQLDQIIISALKDGEISKEELTKIWSHDAILAKQIEEFIDSRQRAANVVATIAGIAAATAFSVMTGGAGVVTLTPFVKGLWGAAVMGTVAVGSKELVMDNFYSSFSEEGAKDFVKGGLEGFMSGVMPVLTKQINALYPALFKQAASTGGKVSVQAIAQSIKGVGQRSAKEILGDISIKIAESGIESLLTGIVVENTLLAIDEKTWQKGMSYAMDNFIKTNGKLVYDSIVAGLVSAGKVVVAESTGLDKVNKTLEDKDLDNLKPIDLGVQGAKTYDEATKEKKEENKN